MRDSQSEWNLDIYKKKIKTLVRKATEAEVVLWNSLFLTEYWPFRTLHHHAHCTHMETTHIYSLVLNKYPTCTTKNCTKMIRVVGPFLHCRVDAKAGNPAEVLLVSGDSNEAFFSPRSSPTGIPKKTPQKTERGHTWGVTHFFSRVVKQMPSENFAAGRDKITCFSRARSLPLSPCRSPRPGRRGLWTLGCSWARCTNLKDAEG